ncbi:MAG: hypothetical protein ABSG39_09735 [Acidimicrobiales bacterium]
MADGLVLTRRLSERGVHEAAQRAGGASSASVVRHYVGYEEWPESGFLRREVARCRPSARSSWATSRVRA